jgi:hypothetical protein
MLLNSEILARAVPVAATNWRDLRLAPADIRARPAPSMAARECSRMFAVTAMFVDCGGSRAGSGVAALRRGLSIASFDDFISY